MRQLDVLLERYPQLRCCRAEIEQAFLLLEATYLQDKKALVCGNGGSASDAAHIVGELMKSFVLPRGIGAAKERIYAATQDYADAEYIAANLQGALSAISLGSEMALTSAYSNDVAPDMVLAQQVFGNGKPGDCLIAISTSGNSKNIKYALQVAKAMGIHTLGLAGQGGGMMKPLCNVCICVPETETFKIQELHLPIYHTLCLMLEERFFGRASGMPHRLTQGETD